MPELPEVTVIVNGLNKKLKGLTFKSVVFDWPKGFQWGNYRDDNLKGAKVTGVERRGKVVLINTNRFTILIHLKLTGQLVYQDEKTRIAGGHPIPPLNRPAPNTTTRATFKFTNRGYLFFNDLRKFGWVRFVESDEEKIASAIGGRLGPDALAISHKEFEERLKKKPKARIKKLLMDQSFVSGIGNIYSDEGLWRAKVHPARIIGSLSDAEIKAIHKGVQDSLKLAIEKGGSSANSFIDSGGEKGLFLSFVKAYHMTGRPCARCKTLIVRKFMDGRSAHFCPKCQV
ncbi:MAG: bifunctional DNA-formamidopyrimidine glycosylase/DNA-(apurinic or apyrimidinic site) lyase [Candidatus Curtissbacteria bacterium]|nr:bifunctional DNA-formamidopyrimidine glycosylase/DNA-(apurinic or apyrimidinic site) lyase [Candidatus Curtissbacteria bacterium]